MIGRRLVNYAKPRRSRASAGCATSAWTWKIPSGSPSVAAGL